MNKSQLQPALALLPPVQEVMSPKHGCYPEERGQRVREGGAFFSPSLVSQVAAAEWGHYKPSTWGNFLSKCLAKSLESSDLLYLTVPLNATLFGGMSLLQYYAICSFMSMIRLLLTHIYILDSLQWSFFAPSNHIFLLTAASVKTALLLLLLLVIGLKIDLKVKKCLNLDLIWPMFYSAPMNLPYHLLWRGAKQVVRL